jgi:radical SAM protein with 4Fe4S-binding SPASM domain
MSRTQRREAAPGDEHRPVYAVWELTLRCDQPCSHCGSRAGVARHRELSTVECLAVVAQLAALGVREVTLIGGEAYLRPDLAEIVGAFAGRGVVVTMQTGGRTFTATRARALREAGPFGVGVSIDGPEAVHDRLRNNAGSWAAAMRALEHAAEAGLATSSNCQVNQLNRRHLPELVEALRDRRVRNWRAQLTVPMGNAAERPEWILQPWMVLQVVDTLAAIQRAAIAAPRPWELPHPDRSFDVQPGNNVGYYGPHEELLRSRPGANSSYWGGCRAGSALIALESDGTIKACPSLPTAPYAAGNVLDRELVEAWAADPALAFTRPRSTDELWGFCKGCYYAETCRAGCNFTAHATLGRRGNNPFCYHRAATHRRAGVRERLVQVSSAAGAPYDFGRFEIVEEAWVDED